MFLLRALLAVISILWPLCQAAAQPSRTAPIAMQARDASGAEEVRDLAHRLRREVGQAVLPDDPVRARGAIESARRMLLAAATVIDLPQLMILVDRSPDVQQLWIVVARPDDRPWDVVGAVRVSTGKPGRREHFKTPVGVFINDGSILGYRAQGTPNEYGIRGIGTKGMRVWDFGWQTTEDWRTPGALSAVRLQMHATDPTVLEPRLGRWDSAGCIRIPSRLNAFLDNSGIIDAKLHYLAASSRAVTALLPKDAAPAPLAGDKVVVFDSSSPDAVRSDPVTAWNIQQNFSAFLRTTVAAAP